MTLKKLICACLALVMAFGGACALAEGDLQAQLDAANARIAELEAQVERYRPVYDAQVAATYGTDGVIWMSDVLEQYAAAEAQYAQYGISLADYGMDSTVKKDIVDGSVESAVVKLKAQELGMGEFDEAELAEMEASAQASLDYYNDYYLNYYYPDAEERTDEMVAEAQAYWENNGLTLESSLNSLKDEAALKKLKESVTKDVAIDDADVQAEYETMVSDAEGAYTGNDYSYNSARSSGETIAWNPEGYRAVKHVLIKFDEDQAARYSDLQTQLTSLNAEKDAIENPATSEATDAAAEPTEAPAEPRAIEEIDADIAACATELEALYAQLLPRAEEVVAEFEKTGDFEALIAAYNDDAGIEREPVATIGYAVSADSTSWDSAFTQGAMAISEIGQISAPVYGKNGIHIIYYLNDITPGPVALDEIREGVEASALNAKIEKTYSDQVAAWVAEAKPEYHYENIGYTE